jgi:hypothetical protein
VQVTAAEADDTTMQRLLIRALERELQRRGH